MMLTSLVLSLALAAAPQTPDARAQAERLARTGSHAEALKQFQAIAAANPDDVETRLWIARLHAWMGKPERAVDVYESIIATNPKHLEALIGLGSTLTASGRLREAADALARAESLAPENPSILAAQGRLHWSARRGTLAEAYYARALVLQPNNQAIRAAYADLRAESAHRVEATYLFQHYFEEGPPDPQAGMVYFNARASDAMRVFAGVHHQRKFFRSETRGGGGIELMPMRDLRVRGGVLFAGDALVLPEVDMTFDAEYTRRKVVWMGAFRLLNFATTSTWILSPGLALYPVERVGLTFIYHASQSDFDDDSNGETNSGVTLRAAYKSSPRLWLNAGYVHGFEGQAIITSEYLFEQLGANELSGGFRFAARPTTSLEANFGYGWRDRDIRVATFFVTLVQRF